MFRGGRQSRLSRIKVLVCQNSEGGSVGDPQLAINTMQVDLYGALGQIQRRPISLLVAPSDSTRMTWSSRAVSGKLQGENGGFSLRDHIVFLEHRDAAWTSSRLRPLQTNRSTSRNVPPPMVSCGVPVLEH
jgi:hypothetical protein